MKRKFCVLLIVWLFIVCLSFLPYLQIQKAEATIQVSLAVGSGEYAYYGPTVSGVPYETVYLWSRNNATGNSLCAGGDVQYTMQRIYNDTGTYRFDIYRGILFFNTSGIEIAGRSVTLKLYVVEPYSLPQNITVWIDSNGVYPRFPVSDSYLGDYNYLLYDTMVGSGICTSSGWFSITINASAVNTTGLTGFMLRTSDDVNAIPPTNNPPQEGWQLNKYYGIGFIGIHYSVEEEHPQLVVEERPTIGEFQAPSGRINVNEYFYLNATVSDLAGAVDLQNVTLTLNYSISLNWFNASDSFTKTGDPNGYCTLDAANSISVLVNSTAYKLSWRIKLSVALKWDVDAVVFNVNNSTGASSAVDLFTTDYVIIDGFSCVDNRINVGDTASFIVSGKYASDNTAWNGTYTLNDTASKSTVGKYWYKIASVTDQNYGLTAFQQTAPDVYVIFDKAVVTISANTTNPAPYATVQITITAIYAFDSVPITSFTVNTNRNSTHFASGNFTDSNGPGTLCYYSIENFTEPTYGLTAFTGNTLTVYWSAYVALTIKTVDLDNDVLTGALVYFNETSIMVNDEGLATKTDIVQYQTVEVKVKWQGMWVNGTWTTNMTTTKTIEAICNVWSLTFNLKDSNGVALTASPAQVYYTFPNGSTCMVLNTTTGSGTFKVANGTSYYMVKFQDVWVTANTTLSNLDPSTTLVTATCNVYKLTVYVQSKETGQAVLGAGLVLKRVEDSVITTLNGLYGLPASPVTGEYNLTHARYIWPQLAIQNGSYVIYVYLYAEERGGDTVTLTANTVSFITVSTAAPPGPGPGPRTFALKTLI